MAPETKKTESPPYIAFSTFFSFIKGLAKTGIPSRIDKSLLRNMSGGNQAALIAALRWFRLIDEAGAHGARLEELVNAGDAAGPILRKLLTETYKFMSDGSLTLERATGAQVEEKFRAYGLSGSTVVKAMAFFISACKEAGVPLSAHIKLPKVVRANGAAKTKKAAAQATPKEQGGDDDDDEKEELHPFVVGLLRNLPPPESEWTLDARVRWLKTAENIFGLMYTFPEGEVGLIQIEAKPI